MSQSRQIEKLSAADKGVFFDPASAEEIEKRAGLGGAFSHYRRLFARRAAELPFPSLNPELWRYTAAEQYDFGRMKLNQRVEFGLKDENGRSVENEAHSAVSVVAGFDSEPAVLDQVLKARTDGFDCDGLSALQIAALSGGGVIRVRQRRSCGPVSLSYTLPRGASGSALVVIIVEEGASLSLVEDIDGQSDVFLSSRMELILKPGASLDFVSIQRMPENSYYLGRQRITADRDVQARVGHVLLGCKVSRLDLDCVLREPGSNLELNSIYLGRAGQHLDYHPTQDHQAPHCASRLCHKGVLWGQARSVYYGFIRVAEGAQHTDAYQLNRNLMLSKDAHADAVPNLEIKANDVRCSHGASVGQVGADELFYLMTRGLEKGQAERLLVEGFFEEVTAKMPSGAVRELVNTLILERLNERNRSC